MASRRPLSRERILRAALKIADSAGPDAVTMRAVAADLRVEAMSLYHHVARKKDLLDGLFDLVIRVADLPSDPVDAEAWVRGAATSLRALAHAHPRLVPLLATRAVPLVDPETAVPFEAGLRVFSRPDGDTGRAFANLQSVLLALLAMTQLEAVAMLAGDSADESALGTLSRAEFPLLRDVGERGLDLDTMWSELVEGLVRGFARS